ncbi:MAG: hypothetical protein ABIC57_02570 [bacterium]
MKNTLISSIYFYLVSLISLVIVAFSLASLVGTILNHFVFDNAQEYSYAPPFWGDYYYESSYLLDEKSEESSVELIEKLELEELDDEDKEAISSWMDDYSVWKDSQEDEERNLFYQIIQNSVYILVFAPIFIFHIKKAISLNK